MTAPVIDATALVKTFPGPPPVPALTGADLTVHPGQKIVILGRSGAGKSTLLNILGLLMEPNTGNYRLLGQDTTTMSARHRDRLRATAIGFVFQAHHVIGHRTASENVELKLKTIATPARHRPALIHAALTQLGLQHRANTPGRVLSGGEKQRLAIARAVVARPALILADEPTGNLDDDNSTHVLTLLADQAATGAAVIVITHDQRATTWADHTLTLHHGTLHPAVLRAHTLQDLP